MNASISTVRLQPSLLDKDIIPDDIQNELLALRDVISTSYFRIGDIANVLIRQSSRIGFPVTASRVYDAVGRFIGKEGRTIRYYAEVSVFFDDGVRAEFDVLTFAHFALAKIYGDRARAVLEYALANCYMTVEELRRRFDFGTETLSEKIEEISSSEDVILENNKEDDVEQETACVRENALQVSFDVTMKISLILDIASEAFDMLDRSDLGDEKIYSAKNALMNAVAILRKVSTRLACSA